MDEDAARIGLAIRQAGITNPEILSAFSIINRRAFMPEELISCSATQAYQLGQSQIATAPSIVAMALDYLDVDRRDKVLEIGTGSGYQSALLAQIVRRLYTLDIIRPFHLSAQTTFKNLGLSNIVAMCGDGLRGWPEQKPFDRIIVNAAYEHIPSIWLEHLKPDGFLVMPIIDGKRQMLSRIYPNHSTPHIEPLREVDFPVLIHHESF